jgi:hypothetical protein
MDPARRAVHGPGREALILMASKRRQTGPHRIHRDFRLPILLRKYSDKPYLSWSLLALSMILGRIALLPLLPIPEPSIQDEFSYLLSADTFAHGRLANPSPAHSEFFEAMHTLVRPVYISKYPPGHGLLLALGQVLTGNPYWGVVLEGALMIFLFCWMADAWLPPQWVLIGGGLSALLFFVRHYWFESYWGGSLAACGGALVVGALGNVLRGRLTQARVSFAMGAVVLFFTRPYEGGALCLAASIVLLIHFWRSSPESKTRFLRVVLPPSAAILIAAAILAGWYNFRVTGQVTLLPYQLYQRQIDSTPVLWIFPPPPAKQYEYASLRNQHQWEWEGYQRVRQLPAYRALAMQGLLFLLTGIWQQFLAFGALLFLVPWARIRGRKKWLLVLLGAGLMAILLESFSMAHYSAPLTPVLLLLIVASARALWYRLAAVRLGALAFAPIACVLFVFLVFDYQHVFMVRHETDRARLIRQLDTMGGRHIVFVDYADGWQGWAPDGEWIYNSADLAGSPVVFAHVRSDRENVDLIQQYKDRTAWLVRLGPAQTDVHIEQYDSALAERLNGRAH